MREFERYAQPPSPQMELPGLGSKGERDVAEAEAWIAANPESWELLRQEALGCAVRGQKVSMRDLVGWLRISRHVKVKNAITPALARLMEAGEPRLRGMFTKSKSACDGFAA